MTNKCKRITITIPEKLFNQIKEVRLKENLNPEMEFLNISKICSDAIIKELSK